jgi:hypothetical protein
VGATKPSFLEKWEADGSLPKRLEAIKSHAQWNTPQRMIAHGLGVTYSTFKNMKQDSRVAQALTEGYLIYSAKLQSWADDSLEDIVTHPDILPTTKYDYLMKHIRRFDPKLGRLDAIDPSPAKSSASSAPSPAPPNADNTLFVYTPVKGGDNLGASSEPE